MSVPKRKGPLVSCVRRETCQRAPSWPDSEGVGGKYGVDLCFGIYGTHAQAWCEFK